MEDLTSAEGNPHIVYQKKVDGITEGGCSNHHHLELASLPWNEHTIAWPHQECEWMLYYNSGRGDIN